MIVMIGGDGCYDSTALDSPSTPELLLLPSVSLMRSRYFLPSISSVLRMRCGVNQ